MTNFKKIKNMSVEELARELSNNCCGICDEKNCKYDTRITHPPMSYMYVEEI